MPAAGAIPAIISGVSAAGGMAMQGASLANSGGGGGMSGWDKWHYESRVLPVEHDLLRDLGVSGFAQEEGYAPTRAGLERLDTEEKLAVADAQGGFGTAMADARRYGSVMNPGGSGYLANRAALQTAQDVAGIRSQYGLEKASMVERGEMDRLNRLQGFLSGQLPNTQIPQDTSSQNMFDIGKDLLGAGANIYGMSLMSGQGGGGGMLAGGFKAPTAGGTGSMPYTSIGGFMN